MEEMFAKKKNEGSRRRADIKMVQNVLLVWLDKNCDDKSEDCRNTITKLRRVVNYINTFTNPDECIKFIEDINDNKVCMIISGSLGQHIVPRVHRMSQVDSVFIFCVNRQHHEQWTREWSKIKGIFTEITPICDALKQASRECEQNAMPVSFMTKSLEVSNTNEDRLDPMFMYSGIMKEILLTIEFGQQHITEFINYCRTQFAENDKELKHIDKFEKKYRDETPIWWYSYECFLYPMINRALRFSDVDILIKMGFFIGDLHRHIEKLHKEQFGNHRTGKTFTVYRGQALSKDDFDKLKKTKGGLMSFNNFLSTSKTRNAALDFARKRPSDPDATSILFVMTIDPSKSTAPLASISSVSCYKTEEEVLFSMHTVFRINDIISMSDDHRLIQVNLTLTTDDDKDLHRLTECIREETFPDAVGWDRLGNLLLLKMGQPKKAQQVYEVMLEQATDEIEKGLIYERLGLAKDNQGEFDEAIKHYEKSLKIYKKCRPDDPGLAITYNNVGKLYYDKQEYIKALYAHEKALAIRQQSLPTDHPGLAMSYNNIGAVCDEMNDYPKALSSYEKALEIQKQSLVWNHPDISASYNNIGNVYHQMNKNPQAILYFKTCIEIKEQSLPPNHPSLGMSYNHMGMAYESMGEFSKAYSCFERAVNIGQQSNHPHLQGYRKNLDRIKKRLN